MNTPHETKPHKMPLSNTSLIHSEDTLYMDLDNTYPSQQGIKPSGKESHNTIPNNTPSSVQYSRDPLEAPRNTTQYTGCCSTQSLPDNLSALATQNYCLCMNIENTFFQYKSNLSTYQLKVLLAEQVGACFSDVSVKGIYHLPDDEDVTLWNKALS